jgi:hypothetical protein
MVVNGTAPDERLPKRKKFKIRQTPKTTDG